MIADCTPEQPPPSLLEQLDVVKAHPGVSAFGVLFGALPTGSAFVLAHFTLVDLWAEAGLIDQFRFWALVPVLVACLLFSVRTVWDFAARFGHLKAGCVIVVFEGVMVFSPNVWHGAVALACLVLINAVATACTIVAEAKKLDTSSVTAVTQALNVPRKVAARVVDRAAAPARPRPAT